MIKRQCKGLLLLGLTIFAVVASWVQPGFAADSDKQVLVASIRPIALIAQEILQPFNNQASADARVDVITLVPQNASPHGFAMRPSQVKAVVTAPLVFWLGTSFEPYLSSTILKRRAGLPQNDVALENLNGVRLIPARATDVEVGGHQHHHHNAGEDGGHGHQSIYDPHLWWDSRNAQIIAQEMVRRLAQLLPNHTPFLQQGLSAFQQQLNRARQSATQIDTTAGTGFIIYHDYLFYLENELGVHSQRRIATSPEDKPSLRDLLALARLVDQHKTGCIVTEPAANPKMLAKINSAQRFAETAIDPLGWDASTYTGMWSQAVNKLANCLGQ